MTKETMINELELIREKFVWQMAVSVELRDYIISDFNEFIDKQILSLKES